MREIKLPEKYEESFIAFAYGDTFSREEDYGNFTYVLLTDNNEQPVCSALICVRKGNNSTIIRFRALEDYSLVFHDTYKKVLGHIAIALEEERFGL